MSFPSDLEISHLCYWDRGCSHDHRNCGGAWAWIPTIWNCMGRIRRRCG